jgi:hypothetical protein
VQAFELTLLYEKRVEKPAVPKSWARRMKRATKTASDGVRSDRGKKQYWCNCVLSRFCWFFSLMAI